MAVLAQTLNQDGAQCWVRFYNENPSGFSRRNRGNSELLHRSLTGSMGEEIAGGGGHKASESRLTLMPFLGTLVTEAAVLTKDDISSAPGGHSPLPGAL